jgi:hypothetical protein
LDGLHLHGNLTIRVECYQNKFLSLTVPSNNRAVRILQPLKYGQLTSKTSSRMSHKESFGYFFKAEIQTGQEKDLRKSWKLLFLQPATAS